MINAIKLIILRIFYKKLNLGNNVKILGYLPYFKIPKSGKVFIGDCAVINSDFKGSNTALTYRCKFVTGYDGVIQIGDRSMLNGACIVSYKSVVIGSDCQIASSTLISDTDFHPVDPEFRRKQVTGKPFPFSSVGKSEIVIGSNVWIGWNCTILKGVAIGNNSIVAAGSVVLSGNYPPNALLAGNPAKVIKNYI